MHKRIARFNDEGLDGLGDRSGSDRKPRITEAERGTLIALVRTPRPGALTRQPDGALAPDDPNAPLAHWTLDALVAAARARGITIARSQVRRILLREGVPWRQTRSWTESTDPDFAPKERRSSRFTPTRR